MKKVLVVVAHADDECLGPGGTIARHVAEGDDVQVVIAADCRCARDPKKTPELSAAAVTAVALLGVLRPIAFLAFPGMSLALNELALNRGVEHIALLFLPDIIYTHYWNDLNSDHRAVCQAVMVAARPSGRPFRILCFETPSSTEWAALPDFTPNYFVEIAAQLDQKIDAIDSYKEELRPLPHPRNAESLIARARYWGQISGVSYAEAFVLAREVR